MTAEFEALERAAGSVSRETFERLVELRDLFLKWAKAINLVAPSTLNDVWDRHVVDSAQLIRHASIERDWVDLGSGGGFPGLVVAVFLKEREGGHIDLVESNSKKAAFLQTAARTLQLPVRVHVRRIEDAATSLPSPQIITARALAPLRDLLALAEPLFSEDTRGLFHKGREYRRELAESSDEWTFDLVEHPSVVERDSVILDISNLRRRK